MENVNWTALAVFVALFGLISWLGFAAANWRRGDLDQLHEWGLGGRRFGTLITWFLVGGDLYTAYTFIAVPALAFGAGAIAFFAVPYTIIVYPILFIVFPRLWYVCRKHHYVTAADFVRGRFGNRWLALAVAVTGILAIMPYIALQLVGLQVVIGAMGVTGEGLAGWIPLVIAVVILAAFTDTSGLRAPAAIAVVKDTLIYITAFACVIVIPIQLGGWGKIFDAVPKEKLLLVPPEGNTTGAYGIYATLALGSALALLLYPHSMTGILSASSGRAVRRNAALLPAYSFVLGLLGPARLLRAGGRRRQASGVRGRLQTVQGEFRGAGLDAAQLPGVVRRRHLRCHRHRRAGARLHHVDRRGEPVHPQHLSRVSEQPADRPAGVAGGEAGVAARQDRRARLHRVRAAAICDPAPTAGRHLDHPDPAAGADRPLYALAQPVGAADRLGGGHRRPAPIWPIRSTSPPRFRWRSATGRSPAILRSTR